MAVRAKFRCRSVEMYDTEPRTVTVVGRDGRSEERRTWSRTYKFFAEYDHRLPEDQRFALATPSGSVEIHVDNPAVSFEPGRQYYLDFTPAD